VCSSDLLERFMGTRSELKPSSRRKLEQTRTKLLDHFSAACSLHEITADDASKWRDGLIVEGLSIASVKTHTGNAKTIMRKAEQRGILTESPFAHLKGGVTATRNDRYVTPEETQKVLDTVPNAEWRALFGLARLAGLRTPSETHLVTWGDIDWERGRMRVRSPKTERYTGHESRMVPICPQLMAILQDRFESATNGEERVVTIKSGGSCRRRMLRILEIAGVEPWADLWQTLRRSCEIEWAGSHPQYAVSKWIGHSITVSGRHYANSIPDELFDAVAGGNAAQNPAQHAAESGRRGSQSMGYAFRPSAAKCTQRNALQQSTHWCEKGKSGAGGNRTPVP